MIFSKLKTAVSIKLPLFKHKLLAFFQRQQKNRKEKQQKLISNYRTMQATVQREWKRLAPQVMGWYKHAKQTLREKGWQGAPLLAAPLMAWVQHKRRAMSNYKFGGIVALIVGVPILMIGVFSTSSSTEQEGSITKAVVAKRSFPIEVRSVGELEAARSTSVATTLRTDQPKVIELIADGANVNTGDVLIKIDATPFEKKVEDLQGSIVEAQGNIESLTQALAWEVEQANHEAKAAAFELEVAELELNKVIHGDGPLETAKLFAAMQKAKVKFDELNLYSDDLVELEAQGYLNPAEVRQTKKKLQEELEGYESAKMQYESFVEHVHPMQIKKAETALKRMASKQEEAERSSKYKIAKAETALTQAQQSYSSLQRQLREAYYELSLTEIKAPSPGMVVLKDEYRSGQRRKPRVGDTVVRNQTILDLPDLSSMIVKTKVREIDLYKIDVGKPATVEVDAYPNLRFDGKVSFIGILAIADQVRAGEEKSFEVKIALADTDPRLRPGMTARVVIHAGRVEESISVPIHSVFEFDKNHFCFVANRGKYSMKPVEVGLSNEQWVEIRSGLKENELVSLSMPPDDLREK